MDFSWKKVLREGAHFYYIHTKDSFDYLVLHAIYYER